VDDGEFPAPDWVTHSRIFTLDDKKVNYAGEKTNFSSPAGLDVSFTILGRNKNSDSSGDLDDVGRPVANGDVTNADGNGTDVTPENRPVATNSNYSDYKGNDGFHIKSSPGGALPYKQFVRGKSLYIWSHGINRWQELVLVSENVNTDDGEKITSHGPRSGATKGADNDYSESGFQDDPIEWEQVWMLPNETQVLDGESGTPKALAVWANLANSFARDGLNWLTVFYADPQSQ